MNWPQRDPAGYDGHRWSAPSALPPANIVEHTYTAPDGVTIRCRSQYLASRGLTLDRWMVGGWLIGRSTRSEDNTVRPDFSWVDKRAEIAA